MKVTPADIADIMGVSPQFVRCGLRANKWEWGDAVQMNGKAYTYYVYWHKFKEWWGKSSPLIKMIDEKIKEEELEIY